MRFDIKLLDGFLAVMENRSITRAAAVLGLTQPAVSAQMSRLEALTGFPLFERAGGRLRPTAEGRQFHEEVLRAMGMIDRLALKAEAIRGGRTGRLVVASHPSASISILPDLVPRFAETHPDVVVRMINRSSEAVRSLFPGGPADIGIAEQPVDSTGIEVRRYDLACVAILPRGHRAAGRPVIRPADLAGDPVVAMTPGRLIGHRIRSAWTDAGLDFPMVLESEYFSTICRLVANGLGVSVVDAWSASTFRVEGLVVRPFLPAVAYQIAVFTSIDPPPPPPARAFLQLLDARLRAGPPLPEEIPA